MPGNRRWGLVELAVVPAIAERGAHAVGVAGAAVAALAVARAGAAVRVAVVGVRPAATAELPSDHFLVNINMRSKVKALPRGPRARDPGTLPGAAAWALSKVTPSDCEGWFRSCGYSVGATE